MRRPLVLLACSLLFVTGAVACGDDGGQTVSADPLAAVLAAPDKTAETKSAKMAIDITVQGTAAGRRLDFTTTGEGVTALDEARARLTLEVTNLPGLGNISLEQVIADGVLYMKSDLFAAQGVDTPWVSMDLSRAAGAGGVDLGELGGTQNDPTQALAYLKGASDDVRKVGEERVRGEDTTHFRATVDVKKAARQAGGITDREQFERQVDELGIETTDVDVWIDGDGRARRIAFDLPTKANGSDLTTKMAMELYDFGTEVDVAAPPADDVTDLSEVLGGAGGPGQAPRQ